MHKSWAEIISIDIFEEVIKSAPQIIIFDAYVCKYLKRIVKIKTIFKVSLTLLLIF